MTGPSEENLDEFTITFKREIVFYLRQLINDGTQVTISFNEGHDSILTVALDVDEQKGVLILDWGGSEEANRRFLKSPRSICVASPHGIRNQFLVGPPQETTYNKRRAFAVKLPEKYVRLQRREFFRMILPLAQRPSCTLRDDAGREMNLEVVDIGLGGVALETPKLDFPCELTQTFPRCRINLKDFGVLHVNLKLRNQRDVIKGKKQVVRLGLCFESLTPAMEHDLQRFITHVQREERARMGG